MTDDNGNGKVTLATLGLRLDRVEKLLERMDNKLDGLSHEYIAVCLDVNTNKAHIKSIAEDVKTLETKSNLIDGVTGIGALLAMILGALGISR